MQKHNEKHVKVIVYIPEAVYEKTKELLLKVNLSFSGLIRSLLRGYLNE